MHNLGPNLNRIFFNLDIFLCDFWIIFIAIFLLIFLPKNNPIKYNLETIVSKQKKVSIFLFFFLSAESYLHYLFFQFP